MLKVYYKDNCPYCVKAKEWLRNNGFDFEEIDVARDYPALDFLKSRSHRTVPQIYFGDRLVVEGGWMGLEKMTKVDLQLSIDRAVAGR